MEMERTDNQDSQTTQVPRTRYGRTIRNVVRYEPDEDTVFEDDIYESVSESDSEDLELELEEFSVCSDNSYVTESDDDSEEESDDDEEEETVQGTDEYLEDAIDWDRLTEDAGSEDESDCDSDEDDEM